MPMTDKEIHDQLQQRLAAPPRELVKEIVESRRRNLPHLQIHTVVWLNAVCDPWEGGMALVEICGKLPGSPLGDLRPVESEPQNGWPRIREILTDVQELTVDVEISGTQNSLAEKIRRVLSEKGGQALIFPTIQQSPEDYFRQLMNGIV